MLTTLFLLTTALLIGSFWGGLRISIRLAQVRENELRAYYAAQAGIADAIDEIRQGHTWSETGGLSPQWVHRTGSTFYKSTIAPTPLTAYDYATTVSVTINGDPTIEKAEIKSTGQILSLDKKTYEKTLTVLVVKTLSGDVVRVTNSE